MYWRSGWDSNPRAVARKLISSQPRYDHFDTAANRFVRIPHFIPFVKKNTRCPKRTSGEWLTRSWLQNNRRELQRGESDG